MNSMAETESTNIFIVDDDPLMCSLLELVTVPLGQPTRTFGTAAEFLATYEPSASGCLVSDVNMPDMNGLELQRELNRRGAQIPVIFVTAHGDIATAVEAMRDGAFDFVLKPFDQQDLRNKVTAALAEDEKRRGSRESALKVRERLESLTGREREVLDLLIEGCSNKAMAGRMAIATRTVELHRANVMKKMKARSVANLVHMVEALNRATA